MRGETDSKAIMVGDVNTPLKSMDRSPRQRISKETVALNNSLGQMDLKGKQNTPSKNSRIDILFKCTLPRINHISSENKP